MTRVASQIIFSAPGRIFTNSVIERDEDNNVTKVFSLNNSRVESEKTSFYNGVISSGFISVKQNVSPDMIAELVQDYNYLDLSGEIAGIETTVSDKQLLIDFGQNTIPEINEKLKLLGKIFSEFPMLEFIQACVYYPAILLRISNDISIGQNAGLMLWEGFDLIQQNFTPHINVKVI